MPAQLVQLKDRILKILDLEEDSVRFYHLGNNWRNRIDHYGMNGRVRERGNSLKIRSLKNRRQ